MSHLRTCLSKRQGKLQDVADKFNNAAGGKLSDLQQKNLSQESKGCNILICHLFDTGWACIERIIDTEPIGLTSFDNTAT